MKITFPKEVGQKYYHSHYKFLYNILEYMNLDIELYESEARPAGGFVIKIDNKYILIDFWNFLEAVEDVDNFDICFKYEYSSDYCAQYENIYPMSKTSFYDWEQYFMLKKQIKYNCNSGRILNNQRARHGAKYRRTDVRKMLQAKYGDLVDIDLTDQIRFWEKINDCLISVCVPGQRNDSLDRGQFQYMAFGACTVSPNLSIVLPYMEPLEPGIHYVKCADDYSDLIEKIEWCKTHRAECVQIGQNAKQLFSETSIPATIWQWMCIVLNKINGAKP